MHQCIVHIPCIGFDQSQLETMTMTSPPIAAPGGRKPQPPMRSAGPKAGSAKGGPEADGCGDAVAVIDIDAELQYWEHAYRSSGFHRPDFCFADYRPSLKFAYDAYLKCHDQPLQTLLPALHHRYVTVVPPGDRLDWERMIHLTVAVWGRLLRNGGRNAKPREWTSGPGAELKAACRLRGTVARLRNVATR